MRHTTRYSFLMAERVATEKFWVALGYRPTENFVGQLFHHAQTAGAKPPVFIQVASLPGAGQLFRMAVQVDGKTAYGT